MTKVVGQKSAKETRSPRPEVLLGHPAVVQAAINGLGFKRRYSLCTLSFAASEICVEAFNRGNSGVRDAVAVTTSAFLEFTYAGIPVDSRPPVLVSTHTHTGRLEVNLTLPSFVIDGNGAVRSFNPNPPGDGSRWRWDQLGDVLTTRFGWINPRDTENAAIIKGPDWIEKELAFLRRQNLSAPRQLRRLYATEQFKKTAQKLTELAPQAFKDRMTLEAAILGYDWTRSSRRAVRLNDRFGGPSLVLSGTFFEMGRCSAGPEDGKPNADLFALLEKSWKARRDASKERYSNGQWPDTPLDFKRGLKQTRVSLPTCHPDYDIPDRQGAPLKLSLAQRLRRMLKRVSRKFYIQLIARRFFERISPADLEAIKHLKRKLESLDHVSKRSANDHSAHGGAVPTSSRRLGERGVGTTGSEARRTHERLHRDPHVNGTSREIYGSAGSPSKRDGRVAEDAAANHGSLGEPGFSYQLDPGAIGAADLRRFDVICLAKRADAGLKTVMVQGDSGALILQFAPHVVEIRRDGQFEVHGVENQGEAMLIAERISSILSVDLIDPEPDLPEAGPGMDW
ncbi:hypothetical protein [Thalassorhabdomicrobium marinisediminis]|uniref:hypothetical protein n=1 Tax=Thalassorhabdomicrobium marinisediminis TaxID=2170577 RepID=UPI002493BB32|nr:hypothetical protein [Thalassorhabdomicrobium marinisediminis]